MRSATGLDLSIRETPQSVTVITRQQLDDQNIQTADQALATTAGVTSVQTDVGGRTSYRARGFDITNYKVDGLSIAGTADFSGQSAGINMDLYDSIEVVRGANGLLGGLGDPSATVNLVRKRPGKLQAGSVGLRLGSWNSKRLDADLNQPITADGSVRARLVLSGEDSDTFRDREQQRNTGALASFEADLSSRTTLGFGLQYEKNRNTGTSWGANVPLWFADGTRTNFSRSTNPAANWSYTQREATTWFASLDHRFDNRWKASASFSHTNSEAINNFGVAKANTESGRWGGFWNQNGTGAVLNAIHAESEAERNNFSLSASGPFELLGREHELMVGANGYRIEDTSYTFSGVNGNCNIGGVTSFQAGRSCQYRLGLPIANWQTWDGSYAGYNTYRNNARTITTTDNYGAFLAGRFNLADPLKLILGSRVSSYKTYTDTYSLANARSRGDTSKHDVVTPYAGLVYDLNDSYSVYASYTDVFNPQTAKDVQGNFLKPITGASYETGVKGELLNGALNGSLAWFTGVQNNVAQTDGANTTPDGAQAYLANGSGVRSKGFELELSGRIAPDWNVYAAYTNLSVDNRSSQERADPRHLLRLQTTYRLSGALNRLTVGGGASVQSHTVSVPFPGRPLGGGRFDASPTDVSGYLLFNAMARYQINDNLVATLNISNLFDKTYYRQSGFYGGLIYGEPRRITLGLRASF
ncbi:TonB-dependent siderophore receptor [Pigmentiphaga aceris]|uniref:TonB-dependent siderophore receptor n=2 Tax=Pigmentiphaga aceris TaxID=1940612 RepID=A0A5C0B5F1_9BURK|nr:TonB-dependent siderophore receptor [Pigmentiphaga aceris]